MFNDLGVNITRNEIFFSKDENFFADYPIGHICTCICMYDIPIQCRNMGGLSYHFKI